MLFIDFVCFQVKIITGTKAINFIPSEWQAQIIEWGIMKVEAFIPI
jgi:hypothetical protein